MAFWVFEHRHHEVEQCSLRPRVDSYECVGTFRKRARVQRNQPKPISKVDHFALMVIYEVSFRQSVRSKISHDVQIPTFEMSFDEKVVEAGY
jgi:hypothetical protein